MIPTPRIDIAAQLKTDGGALDATSMARRSGTTTSTQAVGETAKLEKAAKDFEAVFLRQMLSALEKTTKVGDKGPSVAGQQTYGSMIVEAVADAVAAAGGLGLGPMLAKTLTEQSAATSQPTDAALVARGIAAGGSSASSGQSAAQPADHDKFVGASPQGFSPHAVPRTEIRTTAAPITGQLADRRIR